MSVINSIDLNQLTDNIKTWGKSLGFQQVGISDIDLSQHEEALKRWLELGYQGDMSFLERNLEKRLSPAELVPGTMRIISVRMDYLPPDASFAKNLKSTSTAYISRYALGRDYHKVIRKKLQKLAEKIQDYTKDLSFRPFVDSAPVLEHAIAEKAGIGWTGKHSLTINKEAGSYFFLGELFINLPLPTDQPVEENCGKCTACISICPTQAIVEPYVVDGRKCISYLTIENDGAIPMQYRKAIGNRVYGCDDCQLICPWNKYAEVTEEKDFFARQLLHNRSLLDLFEWNEETFLNNTEGSAIRRIGYTKWKRNLAVGLGNVVPESVE
ncbi:MAG: epoxyqueuosine reductase, partial [Granulosicoccus sp.]